MSKTKSARLGAFGFFVILQLAGFLEPRGDERPVFVEKDGIFRKSTEVETEDLYRRWLSSLRGLRHDFLNDIQVLTGYFQLQKLDECRQYLERLNQRLQQESMLIQLDYAPLVVYLLTFNYQQDVLRLEVELDQRVTLDNLTISPWEFYQGVKRWLDIYCHYAAPSKQEDVWMTDNHLLLGLRPHLRALEVTFDYVGCWKADLALEEMRRCIGELSQLGIHCSIDVHSQRESFLTMTVPTD